MALVRTNFKKGPPRHFIREWRKHRGHTLEELAEMIGVTHGALSQLERGAVNYTQPMLEALASALFCTPGELIEFNPLDPESAPKAVYHALRSAPPEKQAEALRYVTDYLLKAG